MYCLDFSAVSSLLVCVVVGMTAALQARLLTNYVVRLKGQMLGTVHGHTVGVILYTANLLFAVVVSCLLLRKGI